MRDFSLQAYESYLNLVKDTDLKIITFNELLSFSVFPDNFFIIRHDVDRKPKNALSMANLESEKGIKSTYYFRSKSHVFQPEIILAIQELGHEIGYHYEDVDLCLRAKKNNSYCYIIDKTTIIHNFSHSFKGFFKFKKIYLKFNSMIKFIFINNFFLISLIVLFFHLFMIPFYCILYFIRLAIRI